MGIEFKSLTLDYGKIPETIYDMNFIIEDKRNWFERLLNINRHKIKKYSGKAKIKNIDWESGEITFMGVGELEEK